MNEIAACHSYAQIRLSNGLQNYINHWLGPHDPIYGGWVRPSDEVILEAQVAVRQIVPQFREVTASELRDWMTPVLFAVKNPPPETEFEARIAVLFDVLHTFPISVFTAAVRRKCIERWDFFPSASEVHKLLTPVLDKILREADTLQRFANMPLNRKDSWPPTIDRVLTNEERAAILEEFHANMKAMRAERIFSPEPSPDPTPPKPAYLSPEQLRALYTERSQEDSAIGRLARARLNSPDLRECPRG